MTVSAQLPHFEVSVKKSGNRIVANVETESADQYGHIEVAFYLLKDGTAIWRGGYSELRESVFIAESAGEYAVKAFVRIQESKKSRTSESITFAVEDCVDRPNGPGSPPPGRLPFTRLSPPHSDFAVFSTLESDSPERIDRLQSVLVDSGLSLAAWHTEVGQFNLIAAPDVVDNESDIAFSGTAKVGSRLIVGPKEAGSCDASELSESLGDFAFARRRATGVEVESDYFGVGKIYYFASTTFVCVTNRYHLLLELLSANGVNVALNRVKARATLQAVNQPFTQNFTEDMDIQGCKMLRADKKILMTGNSLEFTDSAIAQIVNEPTTRELSVEDYQSRIQRAASEITDNLRAAIDHPDFDAVRVDLTGGMDARLVFAALSHLEDRGDRVHIHTSDVKGSPLDLSISLALTKLGSWRYDTLKRTIRQISSRQSTLENCSINLGSYFGIRPEQHRSSLGGTLRVNGFYGEISARPYFARMVFGTPMANLEPSEFISEYVASVGPSDRPMGHVRELIVLLREEFEDLPGESATARLDSYYLYYRNGLHCSDRWLSHALAPAWGPLQSKELFELKWLTFNTHESIKVQVDVTEYLNETAALVPIGRARDNVDRAKVDSKYAVEWEDLPASLGLDSSDFERYAEANRVRGERLCREPQFDSQLISVENAQFGAELSSWIAEALEFLVSYSGLLTTKEAHAISAWTLEWCTAEGRMQQKGVVMANKVLSLYFQARYANAS